MTDEQTPDQTEIDQTTEEETAPEVTEEQQEVETFDREYVTKLRDENAKYRQRAGKADDLARRLHTALVAATGLLADPSDLPFDEDHLESPEALTEAVEALLEAKPHLRSRRPSGDIGQEVSESADNVNLAGMLRARAI